MKNTIYVIAALAAASGLRAEAAIPNYSITSDFTYTSEYVFRGVKQAGNSFQPSVELSSGGLNVDLWTNQPITKHENNEIDVAASYDYRLSSALKLEGVLTTYWYPEANGGQTQNSWEPGINATYTIAGFSPTLSYFHDFRLRSDTLQAAVGYSIPLPAIGASVDTNVHLGTVSTRDLAPDANGPQAMDAYSYYGLDVSIPYKLNNNATFTVGGHYSVDRNLAGEGGPAGTLPRQAFWFTTGITIGF